MILSRYFLSRGITQQSPSLRPLGRAPANVGGRRATRELDAVFAWRSKPSLIVSDHRTKFASKAMLACARSTRVAWYFITPGKPMRNGVREAIDGRTRDELLKETIFQNLDHAGAALARWIAG